MRKILSAVGVLFMCAGVLWAEGYQVNLQSSRQTGMGHTGTGLNLGASSIHFNPGALAMMEQNFEVSGGMSAIVLKNTFQKQNALYQSTTDNPISTPFYGYVAGRVTDKLVIGLGVTTPFGNTLNWGNDWDGRFLVQEISLKAIYVQPTLSYKLTDGISIGAGFVAAYGDVSLKKAINFEDAAGEGQAHLTGSTIAYGYNAGVFVQATSDLSVGVSFRSTVNMTMDEGEATFRAPASLSGQLINTAFQSEMPMPGSLTLGTGWQVTDKLLIAADLQYVLWAQYEELAFDFEAATVPDSKSVRNFNNTFVYRLGAEYNASEWLTARVGFTYDSTPISDGYLTPETPGANKINLTAGATFRLSERLTADVSFLYIEALERQGGDDATQFYGKYKSAAFIPGFGLNYSF